MIIDTRIRGIPAQIQVLDVDHVAGDEAADSFDDYHGYYEYKLKILDRNGRPAEWLERTMSYKDFEKADIEVINCLKNIDSYA